MFYSKGSDLLSRIKSEKIRRAKRDCPAFQDFLNHEELFSPSHELLLSPELSSVGNNNEDDERSNISHDGERNYVCQEDLDSNEFMYAVLHRLSFPSNKRQSLFQDDLIKMLTNGNLLVQNSEIEKFIDAIYEKFQPLTIVLCPHCDRVVSSKNSCDNKNCSYYKMAFIRASNNDCIEIMSFCLEFQIKLMLRVHMQSIISMHKKIHDELNTPKDNIHRSQRFRSNTETCNQFENRNIVIQLTIAFDAFCPNRLSKASFLPFYCRLEDLEQNERDKISNLFLISFCSYRGKLKRSHLDHIHSRLHEQLRSLRENGFSIVCNGNIWRVQVKLFAGCADLLGIKEVLGVPNYHGVFGCGLCDGKGQKVNRFVLHSVCGNMRTPESARISAGAGTEGFENASRWMSTITPPEFLTDILHVCFEGTIKNCLTDLFSSSPPHFVSRKLSPDSRKEVDDAIARTVNYTYDSKYLMPPTSLGKCTAAEIKRISLVVLPLVAYNHLIGTELSVHTLGLATLAAFPSNSESTRLGLLLAELHKLVNPISFTIKHHIHYFHLSEQVKEFGVENITTSMFEAAHRQFQSDLSQHNTHSQQESVKRFLIKNHVINYARIHSKDELVLKLLAKSDRNSRFPTEFEIDGDSFIPKLSNIENMKNEHMQFLRENGIINGFFRSRIVIKNTVYASATYWRNNGRTTMANVVYIEGSMKFGILEMLIVLPDAQTLALIQDINTLTLNDSMKKLRNAVSNLLTNKRLCSEILDICLKYNRLPRTLGGFCGLKLIPASVIVSPFLFTPKYNLCTPIDVMKFY